MPRHCKIAIIASLLMLSPSLLTWCHQKPVGEVQAAVTDPIFQGLAISLLFGLAALTLLTVLVIPAIDIVLRDDGRPLEQVV